MSILSPKFIHPTLMKSIGELFRDLPSVNLDRVLPVSASRVMSIKGRTRVMGILNVTPDSFSDGGNFLSEEAAFEAAKQMIADGVDIIDIGGQSTRPGAEQISPEEELSRILPVLKRIIAWQREETRSETEARVAISVDTFYSSVARAAVEVGASIVNDVSSGDLDPEMMSTVSSLQVPYVMMHMRGNPKSMQSLAQYSSHPPGTKEADAEEQVKVVEDVKATLGLKISNALRHGIFRWNIILDPGLGFAKLPIHSFALLRPSGTLIEKGDTKGDSLKNDLLPPFPLLYGPSRKGFLGNVTGRTAASERDFATAAAVTAAISIGADIVRVHEIRGLVDVVKVADTIYKRN